MSNIPPKIDHQLLGISDDCLIVQNFNVNHGIIMGWGGVWMFWLMGLPMFLYMTISPWLPPYGYHENGDKIESFYEAALSTPLAGYISYFLLAVVIMGGMFLAITLGFGYANLRRTSKSFSPITFNRKTQIVSTMVKGKIETVAWKKLRKFARDKTTISGYVPQRIHLLFIKDLGDTTAIEGTPAGAADDYTNTDVLWEYIRTFMEKGPESLNVPASNHLGIMNLDKQAMYSYDFKTSLRSNWPWPIIQSKDQNKVLLFFTVVFIWPSKVVFFFHNILSDWLWRKMCLRMLKNSKATPQYNFEQCTNTLTPKDVEAVISVEEASKENYLPYPEVRRRLNK